MSKFRINKAGLGFNVYLMRDMGNGWSKEYHSHYDTREQAERAVEKLKSEEQIILQKRG